MSLCEDSHAKIDTQGSVWIDERDGCKARKAEDCQPPAGPWSKPMTGPSAEIIWGQEADFFFPFPSEVQLQAV